jgi:uncharacterized RmlC-like cupin family protein
MMHDDTTTDRGIQVVRAGQLSAATAQTPGMQRVAAVAPETTGSHGLWVGRTTTPPGTVSGWHHHGDCETAIYVVSGRARFRWGPGGQAGAEVGPGDFLAVAPNAIHQEEALGPDPVVLVVARACSGVLVINVDGPQPGEA